MGLQRSLPTRRCIGRRSYFQWEHCVLVSFALEAAWSTQLFGHSTRALPFTRRRPPSPSPSLPPTPTCRRPDFLRQVAGPPRSLFPNPSPCATALICLPCWSPLACRTQLNRRLRAPPSRGSPACARHRPDGRSTRSSPVEKAAYTRRRVPNASAALATASNRFDTDSSTSIALASGFPPACRQAWPFPPFVYPSTQAPSCLPSPW